MLKVLKNRLIIKRDEAKKESGGIIIPDKVQEPELTGTVVGVGDEVKESLSVGDRVLFGKSDGVSLDAKYVGSPGDYIIMDETQIRGILYD